MAKQHAPKVMFYILHLHPVLYLSVLSGIFFALTLRKIAQLQKKLADSEAKIKQLSAAQLQKKLAENEAKIKLLNANEEPKVDLTLNIILSRYLFFFHIHPAYFSSNKFQQSGGFQGRILLSPPCSHSLLPLVEYLTYNQGQHSVVNAKTGTVQV